MALPAKPSYLTGGVFNSAAPILIDGDTSPLQLDFSGNLLVNVASGTITATNPSVGLTGAAAPTSATEIGVVDSTGKLQHVTGLDLTNAFAVTVAIVDGNGNQITSFGGGTQYIDDAASGAHPTGTLSMGWDSANSVVLALKVDTSQNLLVDVANTSIAVTQSTSPWVISFTAPQHTIVDSGSISATQGTSPWVISFTAPQHVIVDSGSVSISGPVGVTQSTSPWIVAGVKTPADSYANPTDAEDTFALLGGWDATNTKWQRVQVDAGTGTVKVDIGSNGTVAITGTVGVTQSTSPWVISGSISFTAPQHVIVDSGSVSISGTVGVTQSTSPWIVAGAKTPADSYTNPTDAENAFALLGGWDATNSKWQRVQVDAGTGTVKVDIGSNGTVAVTGNVNVTQGTSPWVISGSITFASPQHVIVDSGSLTVSGTVAATESGPWNVNQTLATPGYEAITDGTHGPAAVKAASTPPAATDPALVVAISPNTPTLPVSFASQSILDVSFLASLAGDNIVIAAPTGGKSIYVIAWNMSFNGTVNADLAEPMSGTQFLGVFDRTVPDPSIFSADLVPFGVFDSDLMGFNPSVSIKAGPYFGVVNSGVGQSTSLPGYLWKGTPNTALVVNLNSAAQVGGAISYYVV